MKKITILFSVIVAMAVKGLAATTWNGTFESALTEEQTKGLQKAVEDGAKQINILVRSIARSRLREATQTFKRVVFKSEGSTITLTRDDDNPIIAASDGKETSWTRKDGKVFKLKQTIEGEDLVQNYTDPDGNARKNVYKLSEDGKTLTILVTIQSKRLKDPICYSATYLRVVK